MSVLVNHLKQAKPQKLEEPEKKIVAEVKATVNAVNATDKNSKTGFKKGFFNKSSSSSSSARKPSTSKDNVETVRIDPNAKSSLKFEEVQRAMDSVDWKTPDFYKAMMHRPEIVSGLNDPEMMNAVGEFSKDPRAAMLKYKDREDVRKFIMSFADLMGTKFQQLAEEQKNSPVQSDPLINKFHVNHINKKPEGAKIEELIDDID
eukprot:GDKK01007723.1.p1 GENE.GDKK01007723.1~~GDKK01007723.1.p1  ORF type:complete len:228 (+),score=59.62 GDKK01007723.1:75-686(+)